MRTTKTKKTKKRVIDKSYVAVRKIRGEKRDVVITRYKDGKESVNMWVKKKRGRKPLIDVVPLARGVAEHIQSFRSGKARNRDSKTTSKKIVKDSRWKKNPGMYDYPGIDTKGEGRDPHYEYRITEKKKKEKKKKSTNASKRMSNNTEELKWRLRVLRKTDDPKKKEKLRNEISVLKRKINKDNARAAKLQ
jgi:hypothetical protein